MRRVRFDSGSGPRGCAVVLVGLAGALAGCASDHPPIETCEEQDGIVPDCRYHNPEDLVPSPAGRFLIISQFGGMEGGEDGSLVALDLETDRLETLYPREQGDAPAAAADGWGDPACEPPRSFSPHGIDIERLDSGSHALYAVNHGGRESVEMFEVREDGGLSLTWRGCVTAPESAFFNDLVVLRDGGFWVSHMYPREASVLWAALRMQFFGHRPGRVYAWSREEGFLAIPGTETAFANGVEKSADEGYLFLNSYFGDAVRKVDVESGRTAGAASVSSPDNLAWAPDGRLLAASHQASLPDMLACRDLDSGSCGFRFQIVAIEPESMIAQVLLDHAGPPMGAATVAVPHRNWIWLGTFAGDRIARVPASILTSSHNGR